MFFAVSHISGYKFKYVSWEWVAGVEMGVIFCVGIFNVVLTRIYLSA